MLILCLVLLCGLTQAYSYNYAVQPRPIEFSTVPQSQKVVEGDSVRLICNFSVTSLGSKYHKPHTVWRKNGTHTQLVEEGGYSVLELSPVTPKHAGYYECLAVDGKKRLEKLGKGHYITSSPRAYLDVVSLEDISVDSGSGSTLEPYGIKIETLLQGEPFEIPCSISTISTPSHIDWYKNGTLINDKKMVLSNGSLLLRSVSMESGGDYQCIVWFGNHSLEGPIHQLHVSEDLYTGAPQLSMDPPTATLTGDRLSIMCYVTGIIDTLSALQVEVARDDEVFLSSSFDASAGYKRFYVTQAGHYECRLLQNESIIFRASAIVVTDLVSTSEDVTIFLGDVNGEALTCGDGEYDSVYWYWNGELLPSDGTTHHLMGQSEEAVGVYQCFKTTTDGALYQHTWRVFERLFTNPPTNLKCKVRFRGQYDSRPLVEMQWERPDFVALDGLRTNEYAIISTNGIDFDIPKRFDQTDMIFYTEIYKEMEGIDDIETTEEVYQFSVSLATGGPRYRSAPAVCDINLIMRALDPPLPFHTICPTTYTPRQSVIYRWNNPLAAPNSGVPVLKIGLEAICLYGNHSLYDYSWSCNTEIIFNECSDDRVFDPDQLEFNLNLTTMDPSATSTSSSSDDYIIPSGAVCVATGSYLLDHNLIPSESEPVSIPRAVCITPPAEREEAVRLGLVCSGGMMEMTWNTSLTSFRHTANITLYTTCLNTQRTLDELFSVTDASFAGNETVNGNYSLCTFYGWFTDTEKDSQVTIPPAQCYMDTDSTFYPPVLVPNTDAYVAILPSSPTQIYSTTTVAASTRGSVSLTKQLQPSPHPPNTTNTESNFDKERIWIILTIVVVVLSVVCILTLIVALLYYSIKRCIIAKKIKELTRNTMDDQKFYL